MPKCSFYAKQVHGLKTSQKETGTPECCSDGQAWCSLAGSTKCGIRSLRFSAVFHCSQVWREMGTAGGQFILPETLLGV